MRLSGVSLCLAAVGALAAGCGGSSGDATTPAAATGFEAYTACLAQNGVTLPQTSRSPGTGQRSPGASGRPRPSGSVGDGQAGGGQQGGGGQGGGFGGGGGGFGGGFLGTQAPTGVDQAAWEKAQKACESVRPTGGAGGNGGNNTALTAYRNCLTEHGVTASAGTNRLNTADPTVAAAEKACAALRPTTQPRPTLTPGS
jgi:hypothetical protein